MSEEIREGGKKQKIYFENPKRGDRNLASGG